MKKLMIIFGMFLMVTAGCQEEPSVGHETVVLHAQYIEPGAEEPYEGERTFNYDSGELKQKVQYTNGYPQILETYYRSGEKRTKLIVNEGGQGDVGTQIHWYENGQKSFESVENRIREWFENGQLKTEAHYDSAGILHGQTKVWYEDGSLKGKENYVQGNLDGERIKWDENGQQIVSETYREGKLISG